MRNDVYRGPSGMNLVAFARTWCKLMGEVYGVKQEATTIFYEGKPIWTKEDGVVEDRQDPDNP